MIIIGAAPVGLCLTLALAQVGIPVTLVEALSDGEVSGSGAAGW